MKMLLKPDNRIGIGRVEECMCMCVCGGGGDVIRVTSSDV